MRSPTNPHVGMRVIYGREGFARSGYLGTVTKINDRLGTFTVDWDNILGDPTTYTTPAWSKTRFKGKLRDRDKHFVFFDENCAKNQKEFPYIFNCGFGHQTVYNVNIEEENVKKDKVKQVLINKVNIGTATVRELISLVKALKEDTAELKSININSSKIASMIKENEEAIELVVKELDSRE